MPWNLLILPLVAGYYLLTRSYLFRFKQQRLDRQRLIFESVLLGVVLVVFTYILRFIGESFPPTKEIILVLYSFIPIKTPYAGTTFATLLIAFVLHAANYILKKEKFVKKAIKDVGNEFELIAKSSFTDKNLLQFTLDNDKVYIAWVKELPIPSISNYIRVIPAFSGYREDKGKEVVFTTQYLSVYAEYIKEGKAQRIDELNTDLIITLDNIVAVSFFDIDIYERFNLQKVTPVAATA